jgi:hypothetical protein
MSNPNATSPNITVDPGLERYYAEFEPNLQVFGNYLRQYHDLSEEVIGQTPIHFSAEEHRSDITDEFYSSTYNLESSKIEIYPINIVRHYLLPQFRAIQASYSPEAVDLNAHTGKVTDTVCKNMLSRYADSRHSDRATEIDLYNLDAVLDTKHLYDRTMRRCLAAWGLADAGLIAAEVMLDLPADIVVGSGLVAAITGMLHARYRTREAVKNHVRLRQAFSPYAYQAYANESNPQEGFVSLRLQPEIVSDPESFYHRLLKQEKEKPA